ncbi:MAG: ATP-dependent sacrificial sulfur transferase LarE [Lachnospiraceae bacterium]|nr:ATP-dependent sacrificial sulfur transferase LarE [Lachnospiraceae bacterium]
MKEQLKEQALKEYLKNLGSVAIAFSGGVDSTYLVSVAAEVLGKNAIALTAKSAAIPMKELQGSIDFCKEKGIEQIIVDTNPMDIPGFSENPPDRCYICKKGIFRGLIDAAEKQGIVHVAEGSNVDDTGDYRPGMKALKELGLLSPLMEVGLSKADIRFLSKERNLPTWNVPSAACLASRFAYGEVITKEKLGMVEKAEELLREKGFSQLRVRMHGDSLARIEVIPAEMDKLYEQKTEIVSGLKTLGFDYITMDLKGYRMGSMNEILKKEK